MASVGTVTAGFAARVPFTIIVLFLLKLVLESTGKINASMEIIGGNNRKNPFLFQDTKLKLIHSENLEYKELTKAA